MERWKVITPSQAAQGLVPSPRDLLWHEDPKRPFFLAQKEGGKEKSPSQLQECWILTHP